MLEPRPIPRSQLPEAGRFVLAAPIGDLIRSADTGATTAATELFARLYRELHELAEHHLRRGGSDLTLGTTTLVHEAYLNIAARESLNFPDRSRFLAYASRAMRGLVIDYARRQRALKHGGGFQITSSKGEEVAGGDDSASADLERLGEGLETLAAADPALAELVDLHYFAGFTLVEIAGLREVSVRTVQRDWLKARLLLLRVIEGGPGGSGE